MAASEWIRFQRAFGIGTVRAAKALSLWGSALAALSASDQELRALGMSGEDISRVHQARTFSTDGILRFCEQNHIRILTREDEGYPQRLREIFSPPALLYVAGDWESLDETLCIAVVGTRQLSPYGALAARQISGELAMHGVVTVSGLAAGIDSCCHSATVEAGGKTIAVQGCGIDVTYPRHNRKLKNAIIASGGAVISEFEPGAEPLPYHFPIRNRIIAGLSQGTLVVEGRQKSGSLITAGFALTEGRDVFAVPGNIDQLMSEAPNWLIREGATMVRSADDILEEYEHLIYKEYHMMPLSSAAPVTIGTYEAESPSTDRKKSTTASPPSQTEHLNERQRTVLGALSAEPASTDEIIEKCGLPVSAVLSVLTQLEIFGIIKVHAGHRFSR